MRFSIRRNWKGRRNKGTSRRKSGSDLSGNWQIVRCRLFIYLYRSRNPAWRNLDCRVQWNLHNQRWGHCRCVGSWKGATYRKWSKGELAGWSYLAGFLAKICKVSTVLTDYEKCLSGYFD